MRIVRLRLAAAVGLALACAVLVSACGGSSSSDAQSLLRQTFSGNHQVKSGVLDFGLSITPSGSSTLKTPISLALSGPFQSRGTGNLPASNFSINLQALGHHGQLGLISTGTQGFVTLGSDAYQLPAADYQKLASATGSGTGGLSKLGIDPLHWLRDPSVVGSDSVGGAATTHIRARVNVAALLGDISTLLQKTSATGATGSIPTTISPATRQQIASTVKNPTVDVWTGQSDKTLRKLSVNLNVPVSGQAASLLGGLTSAGIGLNLQYANLNQSQTVTAPTHVLPFSGFETRLRGVIAQIQSEFGSSALGSGSGSGSSAGSGTASGSGSGSTGSNVTGYSTCIQNAAGNVTKMQKCAAFLSGGG